MADIRVVIGLRHDHRGALDVVVNEILDLEPSFVVDVVEPMGQIRRDLDPRGPIRQHGEVRVLRVPQAIGERRSVDVLVD